MLLGKVTIDLMNLKLLLPFYFLASYLREIEGNPHEKILSRHFPLVVKLTRGQSFTLASYSLGTLYSHLDHFTLDLQRSWGRFQVKTFVAVAFLQKWLWKHFRNYASVSRVLSSYKTSLPSPQGLPRF